MYKIGDCRYIYKFDLFVIEVIVSEGTYRFNNQIYCSRTRSQNLLRRSAIQKPLSGEYSIEKPSRRGRLFYTRSMLYIYVFCIYLFWLVEPPTTCYCICIGNDKFSSPATNNISYCLMVNRKFLIWLEYCANRFEKLNRIVQLNKEIYENCLHVVRMCD